ncbi:DUF2218 domain-containing protein [Celeribacter sp.]|uniref:DUF2218 domain-containing protein n=1 Tax=Celeribacter sp. TaxID=1890673 RepID=UPI003A94EE57
MPRQTGTFHTAHASKYLQQMCKHFAHKVEVNYDPTHGEAKMPFGTATFDATDELLTVTLDAQAPEQLDKARDVIDVHLQKFAFREEFDGMNWEEAV